MKHCRCAVVGAANIDIGGFPEAAVRLRDSNPGRVTLSAGGVGRNIACNLGRMGVETHLVTALGDDAFADIIRGDCAKSGVALDMACAFEDAHSSAYLFIANADGDMALAVNDMSICARLAPELLASRLDAMNAMDAVVLDANLPGPTIAWLAERLTVPVLADAVSAAKAPRLTRVLDRLSVVKPNALEAEVLTGIAVVDDNSALSAARKLVSMGARRAFVTLGARGVCCADAEEAAILSGGPVRLVNATGAGDAFTAALAWALLNGMGLRDCARAGLAAASIAVEAIETVSPALDEDKLLERMKKIG